jgi:hypothetical protein
MSPGVQNNKMGSDAPGTSENEYGCAKHENETSRLRYPTHTSPGAKNKKTGPDAFGIAGNESGSAKHENGTRRPRYHPK